LKRRRAQAEEKAHGPRAQRARLILLVLAVGAGLLAILGRCAHLQVIRAPELLDQARAQQEERSRSIRCAARSSTATARSWP